MARGTSILAEIGAGLGAIGDVLTQLRQQELNQALLQHRLQTEQERLRHEAIRTQLLQEQHQRQIQKEEEARAAHEAMVARLKESAPTIERTLGIPADLLTSVLAYEPKSAFQAMESLIPRRFVEERPHITTVGGKLLAVSPSTQQVQVLYEGEDPVEKQLRLMAAREEMEPIAVYDKQTGQVITGNKRLLKSDPTRYIPASAAGAEMREPAVPKWVDRLSDANYANLQMEVAKRPVTYAKLLRVRPEEQTEYFKMVQTLQQNYGVQPEEEIPLPKPPAPPSPGAVIKNMPEPK